MCMAATAQTTVKGIITDKETKQPLAFASIVFNNKNTLSVIADIDGKFSFSAQETLTTATCSYVGYSSETVTVTNANHNSLNFSLQFAQNQLQELVITPGDNPAERIMRKVIANKDLNDPDNLTAYTCNSYNKVAYDFKNSNAADSIKIKQFLKGGHFFMMESVTERKYLKPNRTEEKIIATKVSGFKNPSFAATATDLQPFSFYKDNIKFLNVNYLNPISKGSISKYRFTLQDTLFQGKDTVYVISYKPRQHKKFESLTGLLYINTNKYAVQQVTATPFEKGKIDLRIQQQYTNIDGYWFPEQLNYALILNDYPNPKTGMVAEGRGYIDHVAINPPLRKKEFSLESVWIDENAAKKDSLFWQGQRREALNTAEKSTYTVLDSLGNEYNFDKYLTTLEKLGRNRIPIGKFDLDLGKTLVYNRYEGFRFGAGLYTNEKLFSKLSLGGFFGYGSKDGNWKYGGEAIYTLDKRHEFTISGRYQDNLTEAGNYNYGFAQPTRLTLRSYMAYLMDRVREERFLIGSRIYRYIKWNAGFTHSYTTPMYDYLFTDTDGRQYTSYTNTEAAVNLRFAYGEKIINSFNQNVATPTQYPVLSLSYAHGFEDVLGGNFNYNKIEAVAEQSFFTKNLGQTSYRLEAGYADRPLPYGLMFTGEGGYDKKIQIVVKNHFQTMEPYEFLSNRYVNLFTSHNFGGLLFKAGSFQPWISLHNNFSIGDLQNPGAHSYVGFKVKNKLFSETGLQADNIVKLNYLNIGYLGIGAGVFYRYGAYAYDNANDNLVFKATINFTIK